jgi:hypothetical protein
MKHQRQPILFTTIASIWLAIATVLPAAAHNGADAVITGSQSAPLSATVETAAGTIDELVIDNRVDGTTTRYTLLRADDGTVVSLHGANSEGLFKGTRIQATGHRAGDTLQVDSYGVLSGPPPQITAQPSGTGQVQGTLLLAHADDFEHNRGEFKLVVRGDDGHATGLELGIMPDALKSGMAVVAYGTPTPDNLSLNTNRVEVLALGTSSRPKAESFTIQSLTTNKVLVLLVKFTDNVEPFTPASVQQVMVTNAGSVANYYSDVSFGQEALSITVTSSWLQSGIAAPSTCDYSNIGNLADAAYAAAFPSDKTTYQNRFYVFPRLAACGWAGLAYVGFGLAYSNGYNTLGVYGHELGHNFGLLHAGRLTCSGVSICSPGSVAEYGDSFDVMGNISTMHFNAAQKSILQWIPSTSVKTHTTGTATYTLSPIESGGGTSYAIKIPAAANRTYWVEYRQPLGFDGTALGAPAFPSNGAQIRLSSPFESISGSDDTQLLDMTPGTTSFTDAALLAGQSYTDSTYGVTITVGSASPTSLDVTVTKGTVSQSTTSTTLASSPNPSNFGSVVTFTASVSGSAPTGSVNFKDGANSISGCSAVVLAGSGDIRTATCATSSLTATTHSITAGYGGDSANTGSTSAALSQVVNKTLSTTSIASSLNPSSAGASVTFTATVTGVAPVGSVNFTDGVSSISGCSAQQLSGSGNTKTAQCTTSTLTAGTHSIGAFYGGDAGNVSSSNTLSQNVTSGGSSTTTLASSTNPSTFGTSVTLTATVSGNSPTGSVNFKDGANSISSCSAVALSGSGNVRTAACTTSALSVATHSLVAAYSGDAGNAASSSAALSQVVNKAASTTGVASSLNPSTGGANVTFTATVSGVGPTGAVSFTDGGTSITGCSAVALAGSGNSRTAACTTSTLIVATHSIGASYGGDSSNSASTSAALSQVVNKATSATTVASSANPSAVGANVTFTATVSGFAPTGSVNFKDGANSISGCSAVALAGSGNSKTAACTTSTLTAATHSITVAYGGDASNATSTSAALSQVVNSVSPAPTTTTLMSSLNPSTAGVSVTFTATVAGSNPTGSVNFKDGANSISGCSAVTLVGSGNSKTAACSTSTLTAATHSITAAYGGDAGNAASTSAALSQVVSKANSTTSVASSLNPSTVAANVTFTTTVSGIAPTGAVNFTDGGVSISGCSAVVLAGSGNSRTATCTTATLTAATHSIVASYGGDPSNAASTSATLSQVVTGTSSANVALASSGGVASASSSYSAGFPVSAIIDNVRTGANWGNGGGWNDATANAWPDWVQVNFNGSKTIDHVVVYTVQDNYANPVEPTDTMTFSLYGITAFTVQGWNGSSWVTLSSVSGNNLVKRTVSFSAFTTDRIRINVTAALASFSRITEVEAWGTAPIIGPGPSTTTVASSLNPSTVGSSVTFTATVAGSNPTGSVNFKDGSTSISGCSAVALVGSGNSRTAPCSTAALTAATHSITAVYSGDAANATSTSAVLSQVVNASTSINVALASNGGVASASSSYSSGFPVSAIIDNVRTGANWGSGGGWNDNTMNTFPDWVQVNFSGSKTIDHVVVYTLQDNYTSPVEPSNTMTFSLYGITAFTVQGWNGSSWVSLGSASGNNLVKRTVNFTAFTTDRIRISVTAALASFSRITEVEAWGN